MIPCYTAEDKDNRAGTRRCGTIRVNTVHFLRWGRLSSWR